MPRLPPLTRTTWGSESRAFRRLEADPVGALELEHLARLVRRRHLEIERLDDGDDAPDLVGVALRQRARAVPQRVLEADADVAAHRRGERRDRHLVAPRAEH